MGKSQKITPKFLKVLKTAKNLENFNGLEENLEN